MAMEFKLSNEQEKQWKEFQNLVSETRLKAQIEQYKGGPEEADWARKTCDWTIPYTGVIGGGIDIVFTPTSLGSTVVFQCVDLGLIYNATDYDSW